MKKNLLLIVLAAMVLPLAARAADDAEQKGWNVGLGVAVGMNYWHNATLEITPRTGYRFNPRWELGGYLQFVHNSYESEMNHYGIGVFGEYTAFRKGGFRLFVDGKASINFGAPVIVYDGGKSPDSGYIEAGFVPGVAYRLPDSRIELKLRYMYLGYLYNDSHYRDAPGCFGKSSFIFDAGLRRAELSVVYNF